MKKMNPRFYLSSFDSAIIMAMNPVMAIQLFCLIQNVKGVSKELYAASEKIKTQLFHMELIPLLESELKRMRENESGNEETILNESSASISRSIDGGTSTGLGIHIGGQDGSEV